MRSVTKKISGWGNFPVQEAHLYRPERVRELREVFTGADEPSVISRGLGRSYGDAALNEDAGVVLHERLDRFLAFDEASGRLHAEGGAGFADIVGRFVPRGWFLPVSPGTKFITLGGAIAADVHGKNHHRDGCISSFVDEIELLTGNGETLRCSRDENAEAFWATIGGMGLTGAIVTAKLRLKKIPSAYLNVDYKRAANLDEALQAFTAGDEKYPYSVAWIDCLASGASLGRSVLMRGDHAAPDDLPQRLRREPLAPRAKRTKSVPFNAPGFVLANWSVKLFNALYYHKHGDGRKVVDYDSFFYPLDAVLHWNRIYGKRGFVQYQAVLPPSTSRQGLVQMLEILAASGRSSFLAVLKTFGEQNQGMLSFPTRGHTLALDLPNVGQELIDLVRKLDEVVLRCEGRVYLAKDATLSPEAARLMYPRLDEFRAVQARLDPQRRISSSLSRRLKLLEDR